MPEVIGIDHVYVAVSDLAVSEAFYDRALMQALEFRKNTFTIDGDPHIQYFNRHFGYVLRPARVDSRHQPYAPGLHHFCLRVETRKDVEQAVERLRALDITASDAKVYPEYAPDYAATFFEDPDGIRLEVTNYRQERRDRHDHWTSPASNAVYIINNLVMRDRDEYRMYERAFLPTFLPYGGTVLAVQDDPQPREGSWPYSRTVLLRMPSEALTNAWRESAPYQAIVQHRFKGTDSNVVVLPAFRMPA